MALLDIVYYPGKILMTPADPVTDFNDELRTLVDNMLETMYSANGIGLAAPQINLGKQIIVMDVSRQDEPSDVRILINPKIISTSKSTTKYEEGCLSFPDLYDEVVRPAACRVQALNKDGDVVIHDVEGLLAICMQHEIDHLNGVVFLDHLSRLKKRMALKRYKKTLEKIEAEKTRQPEEVEEESIPIL